MELTSNDIKACEEELPRGIIVAVWKMVSMIIRVGFRDTHTRPRARAFLYYY